MSTVGRAKIKTGKETTINEYKEIEFDVDFTQIYNCFSTMSKQLKSVTSFKLLFWLLSKKTQKTNEMECSMRSFKEFNSYLMDNCPDCGISKATYYNALSELCEVGIIKRHGRNNYMANLFAVWKGSKDDRERGISMNMITGEENFINPLLPRDQIEEGFRQLEEDE